MNSNPEHSSRQVNKVGKYPQLLISGIADIFGRLDDAISKGYKPHWFIFKDNKTGNWSFENPEYEKETWRKNFVLTNVREIMHGIPELEEYLGGSL